MPKIYVPLIDADSPRDKAITPICVPQWIIPHVISYLETLSETELFSGSDESVLEAMYDGEEALALAMESSDGCAGYPPAIGDELCNEYDPNSFIVTYAPNDPFQTPDLIPLGYSAPPWKSYPFDSGLSPEALLNYQTGDVIFSMFDQRPTYFIDFVAQVEQIAGIIANGVPRFQIRMQGEGTIELHLLKIPFGGQAYIVTDGNLAQPKTVDLNSLSLSENADLQSLIQTFVSGIASGIFSIPTHIHEVEIAGAGDHIVDVYMLPNISLDGFFSWGGGLRKVVLCNQQLQGVPNQMPQFRINQDNFQVEWKPSEIHTVWESIGQVIYPITMQNDIDPITNNTKLQWTLQPVPIGGGADPFSQWLDLVEVLRGEKGDKGDQGLQGLQGIQGLKGDKGDQGNQGLQGIQGIQGAKGDKGDRGLTGANGICDPCGQGTGAVNPPPAANPDEAICGGASALMDWWLAQWGDYYNELTQSANNTSVIADTFLSLFGLDTVASVIGMAKSLFDAGIGTVNTFITNSEEREQQICYLFNAIRDNDDTFTGGIWNQYIGELTDNLANPAAIAWGDFVRGLGYAKAEFRYTLGMSNPSGDCNALCLETPDDCTTNVFAPENIYGLWASSVYAGYPVANAFNGVNDGIDRWSSGNNTLPHSIIVNLNTPSPLNILKMSIHYETTGVPQAFTVSGSFDGNYWAEIASFSGIVWQSSETKTFAVGNTTQYVHYMFVITQTSDGWCSIAEIEGC